MHNREKLIKLIEESYCPVMGGYADEEKVKWLAGLDIYYNWEDVADHLIANGVVIQKQGEWLNRSKSADHPWRYCSNCKADVSVIKAMYYRYCPECGAKMKEVK